MPTPMITTWQVPGHTFSLEPGVVHLWRFRLTGNLVDELLSPDEKQRAQRLRVPDKAKAFVIARSRLRQILSRYLGNRPEEIRFSVNDHGKPSLPDDPLHFNLSHSGSFGVCAFCLDNEVGVDLETLNQTLNYTPLAERFFHDREIEWLESVSEPRRRRSFYRLWTRKEAWLKGKGGGFSEINLELNPEHVAATASMAGGWWLMNLPVSKGYIGALAVSGGVDKIVRWSWDD